MKSKFSGVTKTEADEIDPLSLFAIEASARQSQEADVPSTDFDETDEQSEEVTPSYGMYDVPSIEDYFPLLSGERTLMKLPDLLIQLTPGRLIPGTLFMTTYRMSFLPSRAHLASLAASNPSVYSMLNVPLSCIDKIEREKRDSKNLGRTIVVTCKDVRVHKIFLQAKNSDPSCSDVSILSDSEIDRALSAMCAYAFPNNVQFVFAFQHNFPPAGLARLPPYDAMAEIRRMGAVDMSILGGSSWWRVSTMNDKYKLCPSYPRLVVVPSRITDDELFAVAAFRAGQRFPILSWVSKDSGASIWRSAQPKIGAYGSCVQDETYLDIIAHSCVSRLSPEGLIKTSGVPLLHILDCRPKTSAMANRAAGAGYEPSANYPNTKLDFMNIGNIHVMRESLRALSTLFTYPGNLTGSDVTFGKQIEDTNWLTHVRLVLKCAWECARSIQKGVPVLVHCSHGWDRTSQVVALAQVMLDPYYRTFDGFRVLVEKEWLAAGHPFHLRCAHSLDRATRDEDNTSPIFFQFLDCMHQLVRQFPHYFEYSTRYLLVIADHIFSCRFGTFLGNCESDRDAAGTRSNCPDLWTYLHHNRSYLRSEHFMDPFSEDTPTTLLFLPPLSKILRNVCLWSEYFHRWSAIPTIITPPECISALLNREGVFRPTLFQDDPYRIEEELDSDTVSFPPRHPDLDLPAMAGASDMWEAAYRSARTEAGVMGRRSGDATSNYQSLPRPDISQTLLRDITEDTFEEPAALNTTLEASLSNTRPQDEASLSDEASVDLNADGAVPVVAEKEKQQDCLESVQALQATVNKQQQTIDKLMELLAERGYDMREFDLCPEGTD
eukprot:CAMPEP_0185028042 /NCGR_PEP_ID=MMETSP1103-20130426/13482_1 /TAXON_ID=36769 /ORGANISM="Paraphysomonas bandaiensis, Strain Caron Lab Isolate" /LENGTH=831 /DNA_ID=CAMNT_0027562281 /DNA_START=33 /DNA_END=2528 /DNA_ORIENTATION=+